VVGKRRTESGDFHTGGHTHLKRDRCGRMFREGSAPFRYDNGEAWMVGEAGKSRSERSRVPMQFKGLKTDKRRL